MKIRSALTFKWSIPGILLLFQVATAYGEIFKFFDDPLDEEIFKNSLKSLRRTKRSMTTICVEIKPSSPQDEPYYMCKGAQLPFGENAAPNSFSGSYNSKNNENESLQPFRGSEGSLQKPSQEKNFPATSSIFPNKPKLSENPEYDGKERHYFHNSQINAQGITGSFLPKETYRGTENFYTRQNQKSSPSISQDNEPLFRLQTEEPANKQFQQATDPAIAGDRNEARFPHISTPFSTGSPNTQTYTSPNAFGFSTPTEKSYPFEPSNQHGSTTPYDGSTAHANANQYKPSGTHRDSQHYEPDTTRSTAKHYDSISSHGNAFYGAPLSRRNTIQPFTPSFRGGSKESYSPTGYNEEGGRPSEPNERASFGESTQSKFGYEQGDAKEVAYKSSYLPFNGFDRAGSITLPQNIAKTPSTSTYAYPTVKIQASTSSGNAYLNLKAQTHPSISATPISNPHNANTNRRDLDEDVLGVPNWNFSPEEFNFVGGSQKPLVINSPNLPATNQKKTIPIEYLSDPVMRTFYESFPDFPTYSPLTQSFPQESSVLGDPYQSAAQIPHTAPKEYSGVTCPPTPLADARIASTLANVSPLNYGVYTPESTNSNIYPPVVIAMPCCSGQQAPRNQGINTNNLGFSNPYQSQEPVVGNSLASLFGLRNQSPFQNFLSLFNGPIHSLLGEANPMMYSQPGINSMQSPYSPEHNNLFHDNPAMMGMANPLLSYPHPFYNWYTPQTTNTQPNLPNNVQVSGKESNGRTESTESSIKKPDEQMVSLTNPMSFLTTLPTIVKKVNKKIEEATKKTADFMKDLDIDKDDDDDDDEAAAESITTPMIGVPNDSEELFTSGESEGTEKSKVPKENEERNASSPVESSAEHSFLDNDSESGTTTVPTTIKPNDQEAPRRYMSYTARARAMALKAKEGWRKRSETTNIPFETDSTEGIQKQSGPTSNIFKRKYIQNI